MSCPLIPCSLTKGDLEGCLTPQPPQVVHATFREGQPITKEAIWLERRRLIRDRVRPVSQWVGGSYFVMQVHPEHELALLNMYTSGYPDFMRAFMYPATTQLLEDEIGSIFGFRVVAKC
jgi:hypothetical protein